MWLLALCLLAAGAAADLPLFNEACVFFLSLDGDDALSGLCESRTSVGNCGPLRTFDTARLAAEAAAPPAPPRAVSCPSSRQAVGEETVTLPPLVPYAVASVRVDVFWG